MSWHAHVAESDAENKNKTFVFSHSGSFEHSSHPHFSVHVVACVQSNWQSGLGPCGCLPGRLAQQYRKLALILKGCRGHSRQVKNYEGFLIE